MVGIHPGGVKCASKWYTNTAAAISWSRRRRVPIAEPVDVRASMKKWWFMMKSAIAVRDGKFEPV